MKARAIVLPVPYTVRLLTTIRLLSAGVFDGIAEGIAALAAWILPEVRDR